jgi:hypothetical protein
MGMRKILGQLTLDWPVLRLWLVIVGDAGTTGVADSHIDRDIVAVLSQVEASAVDPEVGFGNAVVDDHHV